jgi:hypothetical protein
MTALTVCLFLIGVAVAVATNQHLPTYILAVLFPSLAALHEGWKLAGDHRQVAEDQERVEREIRQYSLHTIDAPQVNLDDCRRIQDSVYINRRRGPLVPDWYYWLLRPRFERDMKTTASDLNT